MDVRKRTVLGLTIIGFVFCLQCVVSVLQVVQYQRTGAFDEAVRIQFCARLVEETLVQNRSVVNQVIHPEDGQRPMTGFDNGLFCALIDSAARMSRRGPGHSESIMATQVARAADSLRIAYGVFRSNTLLLDSLFVLSRTNRAYWYQLLYEPSSVELLRSIGRLSQAHLGAALENGLLLRRNFYRMIMPPCMLLVAGLLLLVLFHCLLNRSSRRGM